MAKRYVDVYEDTKSSGNSILVRDDGSTTLVNGQRLGWCRQYAADFVWLSADSSPANRWKARIGELIGRVEYDGGEPEACVPSP